MCLFERMTSLKPHPSFSGRIAAFFCVNCQYARIGAETLPPVDIEVLDSEVNSEKVCVRVLMQIYTWPIKTDSGECGNGNRIKKEGRNEEGRLFSLARTLG
jgi:hypothetical protein